jgi:hypothetical protein
MDREKVFSTLEYQLEQRIGTSLRILNRELKKVLLDLSSVHGFIFYDELSYITEEVDGVEREPEFEFVDEKVSAPIRIVLNVLLGEGRTLLIVKIIVGLKQVLEEEYDKELEENVIKSIDFIIQSFDGIKFEELSLGTVFKQILDEINDACKTIHPLTNGDIITIMESLRYIHDVEEFLSNDPDFKKYIFSALERPTFYELSDQGEETIKYVIERLKEKI